MRRFPWPPFSSVCWERLSNRERLCGTSQRARGIVDNIGSHGRKISTKYPLAQGFFDQGLRLGLWVLLS